jgi:hypothetical protein
VVLSHKGVGGGSVPQMAREEAEKGRGAWIMVSSEIVSHHERFEGVYATARAQESIAPVVALPVDRSDANSRRGRDD